MKKAFVIMALFLLIAVGLSTFTFAAEGSLSLSDKEIIEKLARLEEGQKGLNRRIDDINKRIDDINKRIDDIRNELKGDIADLRGLIYIVLAGIIALIGFVIWDRRTVLSPVISKTKELEERDDLTLRVIAQPQRHGDTKIII